MKKSHLKEFLAIRGMGQVISVTVAMLIMVLVFGGFLAAGMPLVGALVSIAGSLGVAYALTYAMDLESFVVNIITVIGLGLSIDYGLLITSRYREELARSLTADQELERAAPEGDPARAATALCSNWSSSAPCATRTPTTRPTPNG